MLHVNFFAAFVAGALSVLPACGPALLPAFFAYTFTRPRQLFLATALFALGFSTIFVPFGLGVAWVVDMLAVDHERLTHISGVLLLMFALLAATGKFYRGAPRSYGIRGLWQPVVLGVTFGFTAGSCSAPILGAILTLSAVAGDYARTLVLLFSFVIGLFTPLCIIALLFQRFSRRSFTRYMSAGLEIELGSRIFRVYWGNLIAAVLFGWLGVLHLVNQPLLWAGGLSNWALLQDWFYNVNQWLLSH